jgi:hypothetical protein
LEKTLLSDIKVERERDEYVRMSRSPSVDRLEMLDKSLNQSERADIFDLKKMDDLNRLRLSSCDIKKEPIEAVQSPVKYPESPQYSQDIMQSPSRSNYPKSPQYSQEVAPIDCMLDKEFDLVRKIFGERILGELCISLD